MEIVNSLQYAKPAASASHGAAGSTGPASSYTASSGDSAVAISPASDPRRGPSEQKLKQAFAALDLPEMPVDDYRVELNFNRDTGRVVAKVMDTNGETLREIPTKELQRLFSQIREYLGSVVDEEA
ncbi:flagellar protein FlaG [Thalassospira sp.]|uniref:flagellar protein FlaG n=1 Tax=Thalassospira sp. TaxID=1912094 RepID=UPI00273383C5|nr:flagellar protein FlaG [Thalassospira sp.]MDP2696656.1 flagellar protein FlaG [Thalassospira sp.]